MNLDRKARFRISWALAITAGLLFMLAQVSNIFWIPFWAGAIVFTLFVNLVHFLFPLDDGED